MSEAIVASRCVSVIGANQVRTNSEKALINTYTYMYIYLYMFTYIYVYPCMCICMCTLCCVYIILFRPVCCSVLGVLQCLAICCNMLQGVECVAVCLILHSSTRARRD